MAVGQVTKFNQLEKQICADANRQWDDAVSGNIIFCLCGSAYTPSAAHATTADLAGLIATGDGAPVAATGLIIDSATTPGITSFKSDWVNFGDAVTITAKYLIAVMPVTAGAFSATTSKLLFYVDLNTAGPTAVVSTTSSDFVVYCPAVGWFNTHAV